MKRENWFTLSESATQLTYSTPSGEIIKTSSILSFLNVILWLEAIPCLVFLNFCRSEEQTFLNHEILRTGNSFCSKFDDRLLSYSMPFWTTSHTSKVDLGIWLGTPGAMVAAPLKCSIPSNVYALCLRQWRHRQSRTLPAHQQSMHTVIGYRIYLKPGKTPSPSSHMSFTSLSRCRSWNHALRILLVWARRRLQDTN